MSPERLGEIWGHGHLSRELTLLGLKASGVETWGRLIGSLGHLRVVHKPVQHCGSVSHQLTMHASHLLSTQLSPSLVFQVVSVSDTFGKIGRRALEALTLST
jgi:hypothetical protein